MARPDDPQPIRTWTLLATVALVLIHVSPAVATVTFYTDEAAWTTAVNAVAVEAFDSTPTNLALAAEVTTAPGTNADLGPILTFDQAITGLCGNFTVQVLQAVPAGAQFTHDDAESGPSLGTGTLSVGDFDNYEDDDFQITFETGAFHAAGFFLVDSIPEAGESLKAFGAGGEIGTLDGLDIPNSPGGSSTFVGVVATETLVSVIFDEDPGGDDIAIRDFRFGCAAEDPDGDGLDNLTEQGLGTDPNSIDSDGDGLDDGDEVDTYGTNPILADTDGDLLNDGDEVNTHSTNPILADTDGDGLDDGEELNTYSTNPLLADTDGDGLTDGDEENTHSSNPNLTDTDGDGLDDGDEVNTHGSSPILTDTDGDGVDDGDEVNTHNTNPILADTDGDGLDDGNELNTYNTDPNDSDSDDDGVSDGGEILVYITDPNDSDSDDDGLSDGDEVTVHSTDPNDSDSDDDGFSDGDEVNVYGTDPNDFDNDAVTIDLNAFSGDSDEVTVATDGSSAQFVEVDVSTFVRWTNDVFSGDPQVIVAGPNTFVTFDFDFVEAAGAEDQFSLVVFEANPTGGPYRGELARWSVDSTQAGTAQIDLAPFAGQTLGFEFELLDQGANGQVGSTATVSNFAVPEPSQSVAIATGLVGLFLMWRRRSAAQFGAQGTSP